MWARVQSESSKRLSPWRFDPSPDTTGWVAPPVIRKVTVPPGRTLALAGSQRLAAVPAAGGRPLAALPIVDGLLARVPGRERSGLSRWPGVRAVTDASRPLTV